MCAVSDTTRSNSGRETSGDIGDLTEAFTRKDYYQKLIERANTVSLIKIFKHYGIKLDLYNRKIRCPLKSHSGGRERTPSFGFFPDTNTYHCFGCKAGPAPCNFVAEMDRCTKVQAAYKILELFDADADKDGIYEGIDFSEKLVIMMDFSNVVREFYQTYSGEEARVYIEMVCASYDEILLKHERLDNDALRRTVEQLKEYIFLYKP